MAAVGAGVGDITGVAGGVELALVVEASEPSLVAVFVAVDVVGLAVGIAAIDFNPPAHLINSVPIQRH
jgi:hypothetical protein